MDKETSNRSNLARWRDTGFVVVVLLVFAVLTGSYSANTLSNCLRGAASNSWPQTDASVVEKNVELVRRGAKRGGDYYRVNIRYKYAVDGVTYENDRVRFVAKEFESESEAIQSASTFSSDLMSVWYDPDDPSNAVLETGYPAGALGYGAFGLIVSLGLAGVAAALICDVATGGGIRLRPRYSKAGKPPQV